MTLSLSLIIPAYNESSRLGNTLNTVFAYLNEQTYESEVIVVDDGSSDNTPEIAEKSFGSRRRCAAELIRVRPNRGKGYAVRSGLLAARASVALFSDAELSTPITEIPKLTAPIQSGEYDIVAGSRALDRSLIGVHQSWRREQGGRAINLLVRLTTGLPFWDTQCGFKAFRMSVCRPVIEAGVIDRFGFDIELLYIAHLAALRQLERAVRWDHYEGSKLNPLRDGFRMLEEVRLIRRNARRGTYDAAIKSARALSGQQRESVPFVSTGAAGVGAHESDASPNIISPAHRI